jgi:hypothetical protein
VLYPRALFLTAPRIFKRFLARPRTIHVQAIAKPGIVPAITKPKTIHIHVIAKLELYFFSLIVFGVFYKFSAAPQRTAYS